MCIKRVLLSCACFGFLSYMGSSGKEMGKSMVIYLLYAVFLPAANASLSCYAAYAAGNVA